MESSVVSGRSKISRGSPVPRLLLHRCSSPCVAACAKRADGYELPLSRSHPPPAELPALFRNRWFWSARKPALAWFRRADFLGDPRTSLDTAVRDRIEQTTGRRPTGPIRLLTHLRQFGYNFNPVSFYYVFDAKGERLETIVAEITNTPWDERHAYVLEVRCNTANCRSSSGTERVIASASARRVSTLRSRCTSIIPSSTPMRPSAARSGRARPTSADFGAVTI
ncbi:MAG: DUF1365 family protein [Gammaproteobacteria bacterium]|nr:DUF1365 family protein [Gammaproteobacteria bacterium]